MPFREKSAWCMSFALSLVGVFYFYFVTVIKSESGQLADPGLPDIVIYTICLVLLSVAGHVVIAILAPGDANAPIDERERQIFNRSAHLASYVSASGIVMSLGIYIFSHNGDLLFYSVFASLIISQVMEYAFQIFLYRTSV